MNTRDDGLNYNANPDLMAIPDIQSAVDTRAMAIQAVGVRSVKYPVLLALSGQAPMATVAEFEMTVFLAADQKGTHMSRFIALLEGLRNQALSVAGFRKLLADMLVLLAAPKGKIVMSLPYFLEKKAPISGVASLLDYHITLEGQADGLQNLVYLTVQVPVTSLCPCSKNISDYGAHNQRSHVTVRAQLKEDIDIAELISTIEQQASCELYGLLKRPDEKYVTERAYDNPKFVEDLVRDVALAVQRNAAIGHYEVEAENFESIHNHSAYARIVG